MDIPSPAALFLPLKGRAILSMKFAVLILPFDPAILTHGPDGSGIALALHKGNYRLERNLVVGAFDSGPNVRLIFAYNKVMGRWCTVTVTDEKGQRHSLDIQAESTYDAAHLYVSNAKSQPAAMLPTVKGAALQRWINKRRGELKGPRGLLFSQRPTLD